MPDQTTINVIGAVGGVVLSACLLPQLYRLYRTRSARDLAYPYLFAYCIGLFLTFLYLFWEGAIVAWICELVELGGALLVLSAKYYLDFYGPYSKRAKEREEGEAGDATSDGSNPRSLPGPARLSLTSCNGDLERGASPRAPTDVDGLGLGGVTHKRDIGLTKHET
ncbi:hypothetical protein F751_3319 [Auxenochlorella protothecoides]|uniref:Uncharacterized protein n=1 Tax=Auxenochlorella protothecoides TaxID=3075 RepID=A0A087SBM4_AUXPR|nr:hypothetical protein F751_3319 [Auxenochlorella protothecoides]KFM23128.1 hypothetical protein F751_3319 [Auxenochlorella protothecoides]